MNETRTRRGLEIRSVDGNLRRICSHHIVNEFLGKLDVAGQPFLSQRKLSRLDSGSRSVPLIQKNDDVLPSISQALGELLNQGKDNLHAPWLAFTGFFTIAIMLSLLVFIGEAVRDAFDPRKVQG